MDRTAAYGAGRLSELNRRLVDLRDALMHIDDKLLRNSALHMTVNGAGVEFIGPGKRPVADVELPRSFVGRAIDWVTRRPAIKGFSYGAGNPVAGIVKVSWAETESAVTMIANWAEELIRDWDTHEAAFCDLA